MNQTPQPRICECKKLMKAIISSINPKASEWYCEDCRKSELMVEPGESNYWAGVMK